MLRVTVSFANVVIPNEPSKYFYKNFRGYLNIFLCNFLDLLYN